MAKAHSRQARPRQASDNTVCQIHAEGTVLSVGASVVGINEKDVIYFDKNNAHQIEIKKEIYQVVNIAHVVVVL